MSSRLRRAMQLCSSVLALALGSASCGAILGVEPLSNSAAGAGGTGGAAACEPGASCYTGPPGTLDVGVCAAGTCEPGGDECADTTPYLEECDSPDDENCDAEPGCTGAGLASISGNGPEQQDVAFVAVDPDGSVYVAGHFNGTLTFEGGTAISARGNGDVYVTKLDAQLEHVWTRSFGDGAPQEVRGIAANGDMVVVVGVFNGSLDFGGGGMNAGASNAGFVASLDPDGDEIWHLAIEGGSDERVEDVGIDDNSDVFVIGDYNSTLALPSPVGDLPEATNVNGFLLKIGGSGNPLWAYAFGATAGVEVLPRKLDVRPHGGSEVFVTGEHTGPFDLAGSTLEWRGTMGDGTTDVFVARFSASDAGDATFAASLGGPPADVARGIAADQYGSFYVALDHSGPVDAGASNLTPGPADPPNEDVLVVWFDSGGGIPYTASLAATDVQTVRGIACDYEGGVVITGSYAGEVGTFDPALGQDLYISKFDADADPRWYWDIGGPDYETGLDVDVDDSGYVYVAGFYNGDLVELAPPIPGASPAGSNHDLFVVKRAP